MALMGKIRGMYFRDGKSISEIARLTSLSRNTIKRWLRAAPGTQPKYQCSNAITKLTAFAVALTKALETDAHRPKRERRTARALHAQIKAEGYAARWPSFGRRFAFIKPWMYGRSEERNCSSKTSAVRRKLNLCSSEQVTLLLNRWTGQDESAQVVSPIGAEDIDCYSIDWLPLITAKVNELKGSGQFTRDGVRQHNIEDAFWEWPQKVAARSSELQWNSFAVRCGGMTQGMMFVNLLRRCRLARQVNEHLVYVDLVATAPWNRPRP